MFLTEMYYVKAGKGYFRSIFVNVNIYFKMQ